MKYNFRRSPARANMLRRIRDNHRNDRLLQSYPMPQLEFDILHNELGSSRPLRNWDIVSRCFETHFRQGSPMVPLASTSWVVLLWGQVLLVRRRRSIESTNLR